MSRRRRDPRTRRRRDPEDDDAGEHEVRRPRPAPGRKRAAGDAERGGRRAATDDRRRGRRRARPTTPSADRARARRRALDATSRRAEDDATSRAPTSPTRTRGELDAEELAAEELGDEAERPDARGRSTPTVVGRPTQHDRRGRDASRSPTARQAEEAALAGLRARAPSRAACRGDAPRPTDRRPRARRAAEPERRRSEPPAARGGERRERAARSRRAKRLWARFLAASLLIVISVAAATSISILVYLTDIAKGLSDNDGFASLRDQLADVDGGDPQTILIIGSDKRLGPMARATRAARTRRSCCGSTPTSTGSRCCRSPATSRSTSPATASASSTRPTRPAGPTRR